MTSYIGMPPSGYAKPLEVEQNLSDVPDKAAALVNLGAASAEDVLRAANPIGTIIAFYGSTAPSGYLPCAGQTVSNVIFPELVEFLNPGNASATLPDLRGEFLRGWDNGRGIDLGRAIRTAQLDELKSHDHLTWSSNTYSSPATLGSSGAVAPHALGSPTGLRTGFTGGTETRPRNISVLYCIKAYGVIVNQGSVDVAAIAAQTDLKVALTQFTGTNQSLGTNGYQKLPGGLIMQWGSTTVTGGVFSSATFPISFTNGVLSRSGNWSSNTYSSTVKGTAIFGPSATPLSTMNIGVTDSSGTYSVSWYVLGY